MRIVSLRLKDGTRCMVVIEETKTGVKKTFDSKKKLTTEQVLEADKILTKLGQN